MALSDVQKGLYLKEMGIQPYYPCRPLPGAKPSLAYAPSSLSAKVSSENASAIGAAKEVLQLLTPAAQSAPAKPHKSESTSPATVVNTIESLPPEQEASATKGVPVRFAFAYIPVSEHLAVMTELPWSKAVVLAPASYSLLSGILKALGILVEAQHLHPMVFTWPLFEEAGLELDADSARKTLEGFVAKRLRLRPIKNLLVMAEEAAPLLFPERFLVNKDSVFQHPRLDVRVIMTHSLSAMEPVQDPALASHIKDRKSVTWKTLQPLQASLNGTENSAQDG